jgi:sortase (surface protein transpeptidase)
LVVRALRGVAFVALLLVVGVAGEGAGSVSSVASSAAAAQASAIAAPPARDPAFEQRALDPALAAPPVVAVPPAVAAPSGQPVRLLIPSLKIDAPVEALGVDRSGAMQVPRNLWNVGWYRAGPSPGAPGDAVMDGHVGLPGSPLVFSGLAKLAVGADVIAVLGNGTRSRFTVSSKRSWPANSHPAGLFSVDGQPRLSLITCTGAYDGGSQTYADRLVVEASYAGPA